LDSYWINGSASVVFVGCIAFWTV